MQHRQPAQRRQVDHFRLEGDTSSDDATDTQHSGNGHVGPVGHSKTICCASSNVMSATIIRDKKRI